MKKLCALLCALLCVMSLLVIPVQAADYDLLLGDMDANTRLEPADARSVLRMSVGLEATTDDNKFIADVDGNSKIEPADARLVLRAAVSLENESRFYHLHTNEPYNSEGSCTEPKINGTKCTACGTVRIESFVDAPGHDWSFVLSGDRHMGGCSVCGKTENDVCEVVEISRREATCEADGEVVYNCVCGLREERSVLPGGHQYSEWAKGKDGNFSSACARCGNTRVSTPEKLLAWFNTRAAELSDDPALAQNVTMINAALNKIEPNGSYDGIFNIKQFKDMIADEMRVDTYTCEGLVENRTFAFDEISVIESLGNLSLADIQSIDVSLGVTVDVLKDIPASFASEKGRVYDLSAYKNTPSAAEAVLLKIVLPQEIAVKSGTNSNNKNVYSFKVNGKDVAADATLPSEKFNISLRDFTDNTFPEVENDSSFSVIFDTDKIVMDNSVELYFDKETLKPIACKYVCAMALDQSLTMKGDFGDMPLLNGLTDGTVGIDTELRNDYIYLFSDYYPCMAE